MAAKSSNSSASQTYRVTKHHGLGNDFLIALSPASPVGSAEAKRWCDRQTGIGADGLIVATQGADAHHWEMVLWNADGSRAEISGNGIRCLGQAIGQHLKIDTNTTLTIQTDAGPRTLDITPDADDTWLVRAGMGAANSGPAESQAWGDAGLSPTHQLGVDIGNPHIVGFISGDEFAAVEMASAGPIIEAGYPGGINVHAVTIIDDAHIDLKVWERGVGITLACGSGACAAAWAAHELGLGSTNIEVSMPGGSATVEITADEIFLTGPATYIGSISLG